jgi:hypothetical protein
MDEPSDRGPSGSVYTLSTIPEKLIRALPPAFVMLILLNVIFLGVSAWSFQHNTDARTEMLSRILSACIEKGRM